MAPTLAAPAVQTPAKLVQRVLARFELACPSLRDLQVSVLVLTREPQVVLLPASARAKGQVELVVTAKGRLRTCVYPANLQPRQVAAVEDLAWALYEALAGEKAPARPTAPPEGA